MNLYELSVQIVSLGLMVTLSEMSGALTSCGTLGARCISMRECSALKNARWANASGSKFAPSSRLMKRSMFRLNSAVTPAESLYAASIVATSFTRSRPMSTRSPGPSRPRTLARKAVRSGGCRLPIVPPKKSTSLLPIACGTW